MLKRILALSFALISLSAIGQDSLGQKFGFGMLRNTTYTYQVINQDIVRNVRNTPSSIIQDSFLAEMTLTVVREDGFGITINFKPIAKNGKLPDGIYSIPLKMALDTHGNALGMINHYDYQKFIFNQIDSLFYAGVYDTATVVTYKMRYKNYQEIENLVYNEFKDFFTIYGRQYRQIITYAVGKEIFHPFSNEPFLASGEAMAIFAKPEKGHYLINTRISNKEEERVILTKLYQDYLRRIGKYNPQIVTPAIDLTYNSKFMFNIKTGIIEEFYLENGLRVGDETKITTSSMKLIH